MSQKATSRKVFILMEDNGGPYGWTIHNIFDTLEKAIEARESQKYPFNFNIEEWDVG